MQIWLRLPLTIHGYKLGMDRSLFPSIRRVRAFAIAPATAVGVLLMEEPYRGHSSALISLKSNLEIFAFAYIFIAMPLTVVFGCTSYMLIKGRARATIWLCMLIGALIGSLPMMVMMLFAPHARSGASMFITQPGETLSEIASAGLFFSELAIAGAAGGICFWFLAGSDFRHHN